jgi:hypothetical protein
MRHRLGTHTQLKYDIIKMKPRHILDMDDRQLRHKRDQISLIDIEKDER